jgi:hypothetical protein
MGVDCILSGSVFSGFIAWRSLGSWIFDLRTSARKASYSILYLEKEMG